MHLLSSLLVGSMVFAVSAQAEVVKCSFTEPFISIDVDTAAKTVTHLDAIENKTTVYPILENTSIDGVTRIVWGPGQEENSVLEYTDKEGVGSDGMSDFVFPLVGRTWTGDTNPLVGGCETDYRHAVNPSEAAFPGCWEVVSAMFEDGSSHYKAIGEKMISPLKAEQKTKALGEFLEHALIVDGYMSVSYNLCASIDQAVK